MDRDRFIGTEEHSDVLMALHEQVVRVCDSVPHIHSIAVVHSDSRDNFVEDRQPEHITEREYSGPADINVAAGGMLTTLSQLDGLSLAKNGNDICFADTSLQM